VAKTPLFNHQMPGPTFNKLAEIAADRYGFVTISDAEAIGVNPRRLQEMARRGQLEHPMNAVYRVPLIPVTPLDPYMQAALWPRGARAVISHSSALGLYELGDVNPAKIEITVPRAHRPRREIPHLYVAHREDLRPDEVTAFEGIPIVTAAKAIRQAHEVHLGAGLVRQAIEEARSQGLVKHQEVAELNRLLRESGTINPSYPIGAARPGA
jgi:predicted transcriptional regulator of viral defense system